jgi:hypothetical protein
MAGFHLASKRTPEVWAPALERREENVRNPILLTDLLTEYDTIGWDTFG